MQKKVTNGSYDPKTSIKNFLQQELDALLRKTA